MDDDGIHACSARKIADDYNNDRVRIRRSIFAAIKQQAKLGYYSCATCSPRKCSKVDANGFVELLKSYAYEASWRLNDLGNVVFEISWERSHIGDSRDT